MKLWIRIDAAIRSDPNVAELAARLKISFPEAVGLCTLVWAAIAEHRPNGDLSGISISALESWAGWEPRKGKPAGAFGPAFLELFVSDDSASGWRKRQGALVEQAERDRTRKTHKTPRNSEENPGKSAPTERNGTERDATEPERDHLESEAHLARGAHESGEVPASLLSQLPPEAKKLLSVFYEYPAMTAKQRDRYRNVAMQLVDALDPKHPGPKVRGGQRAKARDTEHLARVCLAVMKDPPQDRDFAIVFVLKKLLDPVPGPSVTEVAKQKDAKQRQLEERYHAEAKRVGTQWAQSHPDEYQPILAAVDARYRGKGGSIVGMARTTELTQLCAKEAGFPSFETWLAGVLAHA